MKLKTFLKALINDWQWKYTIFVEKVENPILVELRVDQVPTEYLNRKIKSYLIDQDCGIIALWMEGKR